MYVPQSADQDTACCVTQQRSSKTSSSVVVWNQPCSTFADSLRLSRKPYSNTDDQHVSLWRVLYLAYPGQHVLPLLLQDDQAWGQNPFDDTAVSIESAANDTPKITSLDAKMQQYEGEQVWDNAGSTCDLRCFVSLQQLNALPNHLPFSLLVPAAHIICTGQHDHDVLWKLHKGTFCSCAWSHSTSRVSAARVEVF